MTQSRFLALIDPLQVRMFRLAYSLLRDKDEAKDVVQDALIKIWEKREVLPELNCMEAWCMRITKNIVLDQLKYKRYRKTSDMEKRVESSTTSMQEITEIKDTLHSVHKIIGQLPEKYKFFIHLRDVEGFTYNEIAQIMELSLAEVKVGIFRARQAVRENLKNLNAYGLQ